MKIWYFFANVARKWNEKLPVNILPQKKRKKLYLVIFYGSIFSFFIYLRILYDNNYMQKKEFESTNNLKKLVRKENNLATLLSVFGNFILLLTIIIQICTYIKFFF